MEKDCKTLMLPAKGSALFGIVHEGPNLHMYTDGENPHDMQDNLAVAQHLYLTTDYYEHEAYVGSWCYSDVDEALYFVDQYNSTTGVAREKDGSPFILDGCKRIAATTDTLLTCDGVKKEGESCRKNNNCKFPGCAVPRLSEDFVKNFVANNGQLFKTRIKCEPILRFMQDKYTDGTHSRSETEQIISYHPSITDNNIIFALCDNDSKPYAGTVYAMSLEEVMVWNGNTWCTLAPESLYNKEDMLAFAKVAKRCEPDTLEETLEKFLKIRQDNIQKKIWNT